MALHIFSVEAEDHIAGGIAAKLRAVGCEAAD